MNQLNYVCFGEVLLDEFPTGKVVGGAPLNVALWLSKLGQHVSMISGVGNDDDGKQLLAYMDENGIDRDLVQTIPDLPTGIVKVRLDEKGSATYTISHPAAWDKISYQEQMAERVNHSDGFFYSTLPARDDVNFETIKTLLHHAKFKIFDTNLRPPHYDETVITIFCQAADFIKMNDDELFEVSALYGSQFKSLENNMYLLQEKTNTATICVTKGKFGAVVLHQNQLTYFSGYRTKVVDTVGAGDSFLAAFISKFLPNQNDVLPALKYACAVGSFVASNRGANPSVQHGELEKYMEKL